MTKWISRRSQPYLSLYFITFLLILEVSAQVTKSSIALVTWCAGSVTVLGPMRTWPCSMNVTASRIVSAILFFTSTTARRRRQNALVATDSQILYARTGRCSHGSSPFQYSESSQTRRSNTGR